jgi:hypothetical protein
MSVKRDYGSFARASRKLLAPLVSPLGYQDDGDGFFCRRRPGWIEGFALQQTQYGDGSFCINLGIVVPALGTRWLHESTDPKGFDISCRLSERGADEGDQWLPAADRVELARSLEQVASWLPRVEPWFARFTTMADVARVYKSRTNLGDAGSNPWHLQLAAANYGFLLAEAGDHAAARVWLTEAERLMSLPVYHAPGWPGTLHEKVKGARFQKPTADELRQLEAVRLSLRGLPSEPDSPR